MTILNKNIFRKYDIRWIFNKDFDVKSASLIWKAFWTYLFKNSKHKNIKIIIWKDWRNSSDEIEKEFQTWLQSAWVEVTNIWLCASPVFLYSLCKWKFDWWAMITASHNPAEYNWFKLELKNSKSLYWEELQKIYEIIKNNEFISCKKSEIKEIKFESFFPNYLRKIRSIEQKWIEDFNFKKNNKPTIVIDWWNWVWWIYAINIFRFLWYEVEELYCDVDWDFPNHPADPEEEENLEDLKNKVVELKADIWLAFDWDWDRVWIVDKKWNSYSAEKIMLPLIKMFLSDNYSKSKEEKNKTIVCDLKTWWIIKEFVEKLWWKYVETAVWHPFLKEKMNHENILFWWESSWHFYLADNYFVIDDAFLAAALFLKYFFKRTKKKNITEYFENFEKENNLKKYFKYSEKFNASEEKKFEKIKNIWEIILKNLKKLNILEKNISNLDWIKIQYDNFTKIIIRASNTSPKIQFEIESDSEEKISEIKKNFLEELKIF